MADDILLDPGSGGDTIAADDISGVKYPRGKITLGNNNTNDGDVSKTNPLPIGANTVKDGSGTEYRPLIDTDGHFQIDVLTSALPSGAATSANQSTAIGHLSTLAGAVTAAKVQSDIVSALPAGDNNIGNVDIVTLPALPAGTNNIGDVDVLTINGVAPAFGSGARGATVQRVTIATDDTIQLAASTNNIGDVDVLTLPELPAGDNNIGNVDIVTLPALASGDNVVGQVKITDGTLVASVRNTGTSDSLNVSIVDASGNQITTFGGSGGTASTDDSAFTAGSGSGTPIMGIVTADTVDSGDVGVLAMLANRQLKVTLHDSGGTEVSVGGGTQYTEGAADASITGTALMWEDAADTLVCASAAKPLPVSVSGTITANAGSNLNTSALALESGGNLASAATALALLDDPVFTDDAAFTPGTSKVYAGGYILDDTSTDTLNEGDIGAARVTADRKQIVHLQPNDLGGCDIFRSIDLDETEEDIKTSPGVVYGYFFANLSSSVRYLKFYNATAANVTVGTTTPVLTFPLPATSSGHVSFPYGIAFGTAISAAATTGVADSDTGAPGANEVVLNAFYK